MDIGLKTDIHNHILPGVDDGANSMDSSVRILSRLQEVGVNKFVLTPHVSGGLYPNTPEMLRSAFDTFKASLPEDFSDLEFHLASEHMLDEFFDDIKNPLTFPDGKTILIEMSYYSRSYNLLDDVFRLVQDGYKPVLAHPERYEFYYSSGSKVSSLPELEKLITMGCRLQLNVQSLTGCYGKRSLDNLRYLLDHDMYSFVATDIHRSSQLDKFIEFDIDANQMDKVRALARNNGTLLQ